MKSPILDAFTSNYLLLICTFREKTCNDNDGCTNDKCNPSTGKCETTPVQCGANELCVSTGDFEHSCSIVIVFFLLS